MIVGQTGSGKSTFSDALANFAVGVDFNSKIRYKLVDEKQILESTKND